METKSINLYAKDKESRYKLEQMKNKANLLCKVKSILPLIGEFDDDIELSMYERMDSDWIDYYQMWARDKNGDVFIICPSSSEIKRKFMVSKITSDKIYYYDLSFAHNFEITKDNVDCLRFDNKYKYTYGKLISDDKSYYTLMLGAGVCYQIKVDYVSNTETVHGGQIITYLNSLNRFPSVQDFIAGLETFIRKYNIPYSKIEINSYKNLELVNHIELFGKEKNDKHILIKNRK